jgi:uncharacterized protein (TIGR02145 family)
MNQKAYLKLCVGRLLNYILMTGFLSVLVSGCKDDDEPMTVKDIDGNVYKIIKIGNQVWMTENLKVTRYRNGDAIPYVTNNSSWEALTSGAYCHYSNAASVDAHGRLYNWFAATDSRNIAPKGWHVPTHAEWQILRDYLGDEPDRLEDTNGFAALRSGLRDYLGFISRDYESFWWTATEASGSNAWCRNYFFEEDNYHFVNAQVSKNYGLSIRCVRDYE